MVSIVITYHNEGEEFLRECIEQVRKSIHFTEYEIIVIDDNSHIPPNIPDVKIIRNNVNVGVGGSFDRGVSAAQGEDIILMACDMRFIDNNWAEYLIEEIQHYPKSLVCTACVRLNNHHPQNMDFTYRRQIPKLAGATILIFHDHKSNPRKDRKFRGILDAKWLPYKEGDSYEVPCILGACYGVKKSWYQYIDGWWGHRLWGNLEPYISIKSYLFGGSCRVAPKSETGHIFKITGIHNTPLSALVYNKILISYLFFPDSDRLINFLGNNINVYLGKKIFKSVQSEIEKKRIEYANKIVYPIDEYIKKFGLDYRK